MRSIAKFMITVKESQSAQQSLWLNISAVFCVWACTIFDGETKISTRKQQKQGGELLRLKLGGETDFLDETSFYFSGAAVHRGSVSPGSLLVVYIWIRNCKYPLKHESVDKVDQLFRNDCTRQDFFILNLFNVGYNSIQIAHGANSGQLLL